VIDVPSPGWLAWATAFRAHCLVVTWDLLGLPGELWRKSCKRKGVQFAVLDCKEECGIDTDGTGFLEWKKSPCSHGLLSRYLVISDNLFDLPSIC
jgi:hypothetical protein